MQTSGKRRGLSFGSLYTLLLLWLAGAGLRITVLAIPPIIPLLHDDLHLSQTDVGVLSGLPSLLFACAAVPGAALIARFGVLRMLVCGLLLTAVAGALRGLSPDVWFLFATTFAMGAGIAVMQPAMPAVVRAWTPQRIGFATAVYANGMLVGETLSAALTLPVVLPALDGSWRLSLVFWSLPVFLAAGLIMLRSRHSGAAAPAVPIANARSWWPDWKDPLTWKLGFMMGGASSVYFGTNGFLPDFLTRSGRADLVVAALTILNAGQVVATIILLFAGQRFTLRRAPFVCAGVFALLSVTGVVVAPGAWLLLVCCGVIGMCCAFTLTLSLSAPALVAAPGDVHRMSAAVFTISYLSAFFIPTLGGISWDVTGVAATAFLPAAACGVVIAVLGATLRFGSARTLT